jgi:hypothetical protein
MPVQQLRPLSTTLCDDYHMVGWRGAFFIVQQSAPGTWLIRRRGCPDILKKLTEVNGLGKEEAIDWIERNY